MHALRFPFAAGSGLFVTLAVFALLWTFVGRPIDVGPMIKARDINFTKQIVETPIATKRPEKIVRRPPPFVPADSGIRGKDVDVTPVRPDRLELMRYDAGKLVAGTGRSGLPPIGQDRDVIPLVRVPPEYPASEATRGTEGWVEVQFSITATGSVRDAFIVDASPKGVFEAAALKAIGRWRYNPKIESGVAVERVGLQTVIRFQLEK
jgi:periplasmic protein TonB